MVCEGDELFSAVCSKVVRRSSVNERSSLYRREHQKEAMVWQERQTDALDDDEDRQTDAELNAALVTSSVQLLKPLGSFVCRILKLCSVLKEILNESKQFP